MCWYTGTISFAVNTALVPNVPKSWADLLKPEYKGTVAISDPRNAAQGSMTVLAAALANGGDETNIQPGLNYFDELNKAGSLTSVAPSKANVEKGEAKIAVLWDYNALPMRDDLAVKSPAVPIEVVIPSDGTTQAPYCHIINKYAAHPNAAKLFREYILTDEAQILQAQKYARPLVQGLRSRPTSPPSSRRTPRTRPSSRSRTGRPQPPRSRGSRRTGPSRSAPSSSSSPGRRARRPPGGGRGSHHRNARGEPVTISGRSINRIGLLLAFLPFLIFCAMFELIPVGALLLGSVGGIDTHSLEWIAKVFTNPIFQKSILNSLLLRSRARCSARSSGRRSGTRSRGRSAAGSGAH